MSAFDFWSWFTGAPGLLVVAFGVWEFAAIVTGHREWTYTAKIRGWLGIEPSRPWRIWASTVFAIALMSFTVWFVPHITLGWWGGSP